MENMVLEALESSKAMEMLPWPPFIMAKAALLAKKGVVQTSPVNDH